MAAKFEGYTSSRASATNPHASQEEAPTVTVEEGRVVAGGYQTFAVRARGQLEVSPKIAHVKAVLDFCVKSLGTAAGAAESKAPETHAPSFLDIGCSGGGMMLAAAAAGCGRLRGLEHDRECVAACNKLFAEVNRLDGWNLYDTAVVARRLEAKTASELAAVTGGTHDVVLAAAVVHWLYSATASFGSLGAIVAAMAELVSPRGYLLIEWVDPSDPACQALGHVKMNPESATGPYTKEAFLSALHENFTQVNFIRPPLSETRQFYLARRPIRGRWLTRRGATASVRIAPDGSKVVKRVDTEGEFAAGGVFEREIFWLRKLEGKGVAPRLIHVNEGVRELVIEHAGPTMAAGGPLPADFAGQLLRLTAELARANCGYNDWGPDNLCVRDGKVRLIDFGWAPELVPDFGCGGAAVPLEKKPYGTREVDVFVLAKAAKK